MPTVSELEPLKQLVGRAMGVSRPPEGHGEAPAASPSGGLTGEGRWSPQPTGLVSAARIGSVAEDSLGDSARRRVPRRLLAALCADALSSDRALWPCMMHHDPALGIALAVAERQSHTVHLHHFVPDSQLFVPVAGSLRREDLLDGYRAPAMLLIRGDIERATESDPLRGYEHLLLRAGAVQNAILTGAAGNGLRARLMSSASSQVSLLLRRGQLPGRPSHICSVALGWPARE